jgi:hypothetical protein
VPDQVKRGAQEWAGAVCPSPSAAVGGEPLAAESKRTNYKHRRLRPRQITMGYLIDGHAVWFNAETERLRSERCQLVL